MFVLLDYESCPETGCHGEGGRPGPDPPEDFFLLDAQRAWFDFSRRVVSTP